MTKSDKKYCLILWVSSKYIKIGLKFCLIMNFVSKKNCMHVSLQIKISMRLKIIRSYNSVILINTFKKKISLWLFSKTGQEEICISKKISLEKVVLIEWAEDQDIVINKAHLIHFHVILEKIMFLFAHQLFLKGHNL